MTVGLTGWRREDGLIREPLKYLAIVIIVALLVLDGIAVLTANLGVRQNASDAAQQALTAYIQTNSAPEAMQSAATFLSTHDAKLVVATSSLKPSAQGSSAAVVTITATRKAHTRLFHLLEAAPWGVGSWIRGLLNPSSTRSTS
jgi:hypothetical protein